MTSLRCKSSDIIAGNIMISGLKWFFIVIVNYQKQHYALKIFDALQCDIIARTCCVIQ